MVLRSDSVHSVVCRHSHHPCEEHYTYLSGKADSTQVRSINQHLSINPSPAVWADCIWGAWSVLTWVFLFLLLLLRLSIEQMLSCRPSLALGVGKHVEFCDSRTYVQGFLKECYTWLLTTWRTEKPEAFGTMFLRNTHHERISCFRPDQLPRLKTTHLNKACMSISEY